MTEFKTSEKERARKERYRLKQREGRLTRQQKLELECPNADWRKLNGREGQVLTLWLQGLTFVAIAEQMGFKNKQGAEAMKKRAIAKLKTES